MLQEISAVFICFNILFSIAELSFASCNPSVLIRMFSLGIVDAIPFNSANAACAAGKAFNTFLVSNSIFKGNPDSPQVVI